jgi:hypothetical protein
MRTVESSAVFQPKQWAEKEAGRTIENRTKPELVHNQTSKSNIVRGAHVGIKLSPEGEEDWKAVLASKGQHEAKRKK